MERISLYMVFLFLANTAIYADISVKVEEMHSKKKNIEVVQKVYYREGKKILVSNIHKDKKTSIFERTGQVFFHNGKPIYMLLTGNDQVTRTFIGVEGINVNERDINGDDLPDIIAIESEKGHILNLFAAENGGFIMKPVEAEKKIIDGKTVRDYRSQYISLLPDFDLEKNNSKSKKSVKEK